MIQRRRYVCYGKTRKQTDCNGQTGYSADTLDGIVDKVIHKIFDNMKGISRQDAINARYQEKMAEKKALVHSAKAEYTKALSSNEFLRAEVVRSIRGESSFSQELLSSLIKESEEKCMIAKDRLTEAENDYNQGISMMASLASQYDQILSWSEIYDAANIEAKKMIVGCLIRRIEVFKGYKLHIDFNIDFSQFNTGLDVDKLV